VCSVRQRTDRHPARAYAHLIKQYGVNIMNTGFKRALAIASLVLAGQVSAQVTIYEWDNFQGRSFNSERQLPDLDNNGFNQRASSVVVQGNRWEACEEARFGGRCVVLRPGSYSSLNAMGLSGRMASLREIQANVRVYDNQYAAAPVPSQVVFFEQVGFAGRSLAVVDALDDFRRSGFNDSANSVMVLGQPWQLCEDLRFNGRCVVLRPGRYASLAAVGLARRVSSARAADVTMRVDNTTSIPVPMPVPVPALSPGGAHVIFYEQNEVGGRSFTADAITGDFERMGFNDRASSAVVLGGRWEACSDSEFRGRCIILRPGRYPSLAAMGMDNKISSVRSIRREARVEDNRYAPEPVAVYDNRRRQDERLYTVNVTSVKAVMGPAEQRCWVEQEPVAQSRGSANVGGAVMGALIGGILGHQVGSGTGKDLATVGGAIAGGMLGSNVGRDANDQPVQTQSVQRCESTASQSPPAYWDVTYTFRGQAHRIQMVTQPGPTMTVNEQGEPRA